MEEPLKTDSKNEMEKKTHLSELVEVVVETQAEVGASGYSVVGGGEQGIFIKEVLKDSPAAKHLSLQKGDQLLSARVYFDNVKYEDALKILQCAEPYKVSFFLKRTVPGSEVSIHPSAQNLEPRGPKVKMQKMSVKSVKPFKTKKMRGGRFGLKRLKENKKTRAREEMDVEGLPGRSDLSSVDVEFVFPKFKTRKGGNATADGSGNLERVITKKKRKIRFPKMKAMDATVGEGNINVDVSTHEASRAKLKDKTKGPKFGMNFPKIKKSKIDVQSSNDNFEVKALEGKFKPPLAERDFNMPQSKAETNVPNLEVSFKGKGEGTEIKMLKINPDVSDTIGTVPKFKLPKARLSCHSDEIDGETRKETDTSENKLKMLKIDIKAPTMDLDLDLPKSKGTAEFKDGEVPDCNVKGTKINIAKPDTSLPVLNLHAKQKFGDAIDGSMVKEQKISLPKPDIAVPKIETSDLPTLDVSLPKMTEKNIDTEGHASTGVRYEMTKLDISLPKVTSPEGEVIVEEPGAKGGTFHKPNISISLPKGKGEAKVDGHSEKGPNVKMPQIDISLPEMKLPQGKIDIEGPEVDISLPKEMLELGADDKGHFGKGEKIKMFKVDVSLPNVKSPEHAIDEGPNIKAGKLSMPSTEISLPKGKTEGNIEIGVPSGKGGQFKKPHLDVSIAKMKLSTGAINTEDPEVKGEKFQMPPTDISLPKGKIEISVEVEGHSGKANMPKIDLNMSLPESKLDSLSPDKGKFSTPGADISLPKGITDEHINLEVEKGDKCQIPESDISLPKLKSGVVFDVKRFNRKFHMPATDISLPHKIDERDVNVEPSGKCGKIELPKVDISLPAVKASGIEISSPKMKSPQGDISIEGPDSNMPSADISFPKVTDKGDVHLRRHSGKIGKPDIPNLDISSPKSKSTKGELSVEGPEFKGGELNIHSYNISSAEVKTEGDICLEGKTKKGTKFHMPKWNIILPQIKSAGTEINSEGPELKGGKIDMPDVDISLPQGKVKGDGKVNDRKGGKFHFLQIDLSLPKIKKRSVEVNIEGPDLKGCKVHTPSLDISLPKNKTEKNTDIEGHCGTGITFEKKDVSLPKVKATEGGNGAEAPQIQGGKLDMPSTEMSFPKGQGKGNIDLDGIKTILPKCVISSPTIKSSDGEINIDIKDGKFQMPSIDISLSGGGAGGDVDVEGHTGKGGKFEIRTFDVSLPKSKPSGGEINTEDPKTKGGKIHMPSIDTSLPAGGTGGDVDVEGHAVKEKKIEIPTFHVSWPKLKLSGGEITTEDPDIKGGKINMPSIDVSLPAGVAVEDVDIEGHAGKERKLEMPKLDVSLPKLKPSGCEINTEGPDIKGGRIHMTSIDTSQPAGGAGADVDVEGHAGKGKKIEMPKCHVSLPKSKPSGGEIDTEDPKIKGGKINMPSIDTSLPAGGTGGDVDVEVHATKVKKFEMPKFHVSWPKSKPSGGEINTEDPDIKGGKINMPSIDVSLPAGGKGGDLDVEGRAGKGKKFEMPKFHVSWPKSKPSGCEINTEGPDIKGGKINKPSIDTSLPAGVAGGDVDVEGHAGKVGKLEIPTFDVSLPKLKPSGGEITEGPEIKGGKIHMSSIDTSLTGEGAGGDTDVEGHPGKGRTLKMPKLDVSLAKLKPSGGEINVEGPDIKGGKIHMPSIDTSLPGAKEGELDLGDDTKNGLRFQIATVSVPKMKLTDHELIVGSEKKSIDSSVPELTHDSDIATKATGVKIRDLNVPEVTLGGNIKLPSVKIPTVDISDPKVDLDFTLPKGKGSDRENIELLKAEEGRPSSGADVSMKMPKISLPKFGRKLKSGDKLELDSPDLSIDLDLERTSPSVETSKRDTEIIGTDAEIKIKAGAGEITKPEISRVEGPDIKVKSKLKFPKFKTPTPKAKLKDAEMDMPGFLGNKGKVRMPEVEISLPKANIPESEVLFPKTEVDVSEADIRGYEGSLKIPKMPTIDISVPKVDLDVSLPRLKLNETVDSSDLHINSSRGTVNFPHVKIPKVDISLPHGKTGDTDNHEVEIGRKGKIRMPEGEISLPDAKHDTSNADTEIRGKMQKMSVPSLDISLPHGKTIKNDGPDIEFGVKMADITVPKIDVLLPQRSKDESHAPDLELEGGKLKMPATDISLPKIKSKDVVPELQPDLGKGKVMIPGIKLPTIDDSFPHGKTEDTGDLELGVCGKEGKFKVPDIPKVDVSSQGQPESAEKTEVRRQGGNFQLPTITIPKVDISLPNGKSDDPQASGSVEVEEGQCKIPGIKIPQVAISLPETRTGEIDTKEGESGGGHGKFTVPNVEIPNLDTKISSDATMSDPSTDAQLKVSHKEGKMLRMPNVDLELDLGLSREGKKNKKKNELPDLEPAAPKEKIKGPKVKGSKFYIGMPKLKVSRLETNINKSRKTDTKFLKGGTDANLKADLQAPKIPELDFDIETAQADTNNSEEDKKQTGKGKIPKFGIPLPSLSSPEANIRSSQEKGHSVNTDSEAECESPHMPKVKKAVFVMVNPQMENTASIGGEASAEIADEKLKQPKIKMKPSFGKSRSNDKEKAIYYKDEVETEGKSKTGKFKLPKVTFSSGQRGSLDVTPSGSDDGTNPSLNGDKDEKSMFGKLKMPKVEFFSPYSKDASEEEEMETSLKLRKEALGESKESNESKTISGTMSFPGLRKKTEKDEEVRNISTIVSSKARTEMLAEREGSESPVPTVSAEFVSVTKSEEREETTWFKVPKVTLSPHSTGIHNITPESSPKGSKSSLPCSSEEASGGFYVKMPSVEFLTREMPSEPLITKTEGTLTVVTKTTKYTETKSTSLKQ
ncbi:neuroblast differentiation-associated protein AHNAK-like isoform X2 [Carassius gibelio]|uniref:neuroblast differentiation-associated protein AHNAK-like isoform X2 n=1 Tax=Carassius gibelio TaxID=101364 RepID=UPI002279B1CC|nr:neuroblast differentiation-associated protein AHNAK-like isoform X2 [Carassius gibelio]